MADRAVDQRVLSGDSVPDPDASDAGIMGGQLCSNASHGSHVWKSLQVLPDNPLDINEMLLHAHPDEIGILFLARFDNVIVLFQIVLELIGETHRHVFIPVNPALEHRDQLFKIMIA